MSHQERRGFLLALCETRDFGENVGVREMRGGLHKDIVLSVSVRRVPGPQQMNRCLPTSSKTINSLRGVALMLLWRKYAIGYLRHLESKPVNSFRNKLIVARST